MAISDVIFDNAALFRRFMSIYPPYAGAGIRVTRASEDFREVDVELHLCRFNRNAMGTHFGGSLYAMTDPFYVLMYIANLGPRYRVWDLAAHIQFKRPGMGVVTARFRLSAEQIDAAREHTAGGAKYLPKHQVEIRDTADQLVAVVEKEIYIRRKPLQAAPVGAQA